MWIIRHVSPLYVSRCNKIPFGIFWMSLKSVEDSMDLRTSKKWREGVKLKGFWKPRESSSILASIKMELNCSSLSLRMTSDPKALSKCSDKSTALISSYFSKVGRFDVSIMIDRFPVEKHWTTTQLKLNSRTFWSHIFDILFLYRYRRKLFQGCYNLLFFFFFYSLIVLETLQWFLIKTYQFKYWFASTKNFSPIIVAL